MIAPVPREIGTELVPNCGVVPLNAVPDEVSVLKVADGGSFVPTPESEAVGRKELVVAFGKGNGTP